MAQHVAGKATRDTLFLTHFGLGLLPAAPIGAARKGRDEDLHRGLAHAIMLLVLEREPLSIA